uniref:Chromosome 9 open reading frame 85 n=1 Tax=Salmo trutta TaxID=8032 RepID=A0A673W340_SALTR
MSSQKGNASRSRGQKHQNTTAYKNDKYGASVQVKVGSYDWLANVHFEPLWQVSYSMFTICMDTAVLIVALLFYFSLCVYRMLLLQIANSKVHDGLCQRCKEVIEWKVKYNKYKSLTQPRTCVKCSQKTVKDAYHVICKTCALKLELCAKCGKKEDIVIPVKTQKQGEEEEEYTNQKMTGRTRRKEDFNELDDDFGDLDSEDDDFASDSGPEKAGSGKALVPNVAHVSFKD